MLFSQTCQLFYANYDSEKEIRTVIVDKTTSTDGDTESVVNAFAFDISEGKLTGETGKPERNDVVIIKNETATDEVKSNVFEHPKTLDMLKLRVDIEIKKLSEESHIESTWCPSPNPNQNDPSHLIDNLKDTITINADPLYSDKVTESTDKDIVTEDNTVIEVIGRKGRLNSGRKSLKKLLKGPSKAFEALNTPSMVSSDVKLDDMNTGNTSKVLPCHNRKQGLSGKLEKVINNDKNNSKIDLYCDIKSDKNVKNEKKSAINQVKVGQKVGQNREREITLGEKDRIFSVRNQLNANSPAQPSSAQLSCVGLWVGGAGKNNINGLTESPLTAKVSREKLGSQSLTEGINKASQIARLGESLSHDSNQIINEEIVQLKRSPLEQPDKSIAIGMNTDVTEDVYSLEQSDLFKVKLEPRVTEIHNQRHLCVEKIRPAESYVAEQLQELSMELSQPNLNLNPHHNPKIESAPERLSLEGVKAVFGGNCTGGEGNMPSQIKTIKKLITSENRELEVKKDANIIIGGSEKLEDPPDSDQKVKMGKKFSKKISKKSSPKKHATPELKKVFKRLQLGDMARDSEKKPVENVVENENVTMKAKKDQIENIVKKSSEVRHKIEAFERINEGKRQSKLVSPNMSNPIEKKRKLTINEKGGKKKGGIFKTPDRKKHPLKAQKYTLKHFWGLERDEDRDQN